MPKDSRKNPSYEELAKIWTSRHINLQKEIFSKHKVSFEWLANNSKQFTVGTLAGLFMLTSPIVTQIPTSFSTPSAEINRTIDKKVFLVYDLRNVLPNQVRPLTPEEEKNVGEVLTRTFGYSVVPEINGIRLNTTYGLIGQEQHLARYPGDNMFTHFDNPNSADKYWNYGMAPGLGAFGYFANSQSAMTTEDINREKYYIAVQTFLAPGYEANVQKYNDFFRYRKMLVVNPQNGKAIVVDIADSGPAPFTGKQLGGSPEVMNYLERYDGAQRGPVLYFFIDDPNNTVPLGPVSL